MPLLDYLSNELKNDINDTINVGYCPGIVRLTYICLHLQKQIDQNFCSQGRTCDKLLHIILIKFNNE